MLFEVVKEQSARLESVEDGSLLLGADLATEEHHFYL